MFIKHHHKKLKTLYAAAFLFSVYIALAAYINSTFLGERLGEEVVGLVYIAGYVLAIIGLWFAPKIIRAFGHIRTIYTVIALSALALLIFIMGNGVLPLIVAFVVYIAINSLIYFELDIFVESSSTDNHTGGIRGLFLTIMNMAWLISPFISGLLLDATMADFRVIYMVGIGILILVLIILSFYIRDKEIQVPKEHPSIGETLKLIAQNKDLRGVFAGGAALAFFYAIMVIYTPIYVSAHIGFTWLEIGFMLTVMHIPFVLLEYPIGSAADRKWGEKEMMIAGIIIIAVFSFLFSVPTLPSIALWTTIFVGSRIGASFLETTVDSYFFKQVSELDDSLIGIQNSIDPIAYMLAPAVASIFLLFFDMQYLFILLGIIVLGSLFFVFKIKDTK